MSINVPLSLVFTVTGLVCALLAIYLAFVAPPGMQGRWALGGALFLASLCVYASFALWPIDKNNEWGWLIPGMVFAMILIVARDMRRHSRYFRNNTYSRRHPYYWYGRVRNRGRRY